MLSDKAVNIFVFIQFHISFVCILYHHLVKHFFFVSAVGFLNQGSYRQVCVKFKDFSRTSKRLSYCFQGLKTYEKY